MFKTVKAIWNVMWNTDINTLGEKTTHTEKPATVFASRNVVRIDEDIFVNVSLENFLDY